MCGDEVVGRMRPVWGLDEEGEVQGLWRRSGVPGLWIHMGVSSWLGYVEIGLMLCVQETLRLGGSIRNMLRCVSLVCISADTATYAFCAEIKATEEGLRPRD